MCKSGDKPTHVLRKEYDLSIISEVWNPARGSREDCHTDFGGIHDKVKYVQAYRFHHTNACQTSVIVLILHNAFLTSRSNNGRPLLPESAILHVLCGPGRGSGINFS